MLITICDVPSKFKSDAENIGGVVCREWNELMDVQFENHKMVVRDNYIKLRDAYHHTMILCDDEFGNIYVQ